MKQTARPEFGGCLPMEEEFIRAYIKNGSKGKEAAIAAGYAKADAAKAANRLLNRERVAARLRWHIEEAQKNEAAANSNDVDVRRIVKEYTCVGFLNPKHMFTEDGKLIPIQDLPDDVARGIASIEFEGVWEGQGRDRRLVGELAKIKFAPKVPALDSMARWLGMFKDKDATPQPAADPVKMVKELLGLIDGRSARLPVKK